MKREGAIGADRRRCGEEGAARLISARTQFGDLRDKVAVLDPTVAVQQTDAEASGHPTPSEVQARADERQAEVAQSAVPELDPNRAGPLAPRKSGVRRSVLIGGCVGMSAALAAVAFYLTH